MQTKGKPKQDDLYNHIRGHNENTCYKSEYTLEMTKSIGEMAEKYCAQGTEITTISPDWGPRSIEGHFEEYLSAMATVETVANFKEDYDAFVIACYGDPGVSACREITYKPVVGIGEASMHMACFVGPNSP